MTRKLHIELHVHPFLGNNSLFDVAQAMDSRNLDVVALAAYNDCLYPCLKEEARKIWPSITCDEFGIKLPNGKYLLNAGEYNTQENLHILTVGSSMPAAKPYLEIRRAIDVSLENRALVVLDHPFVDNEKTNTAGHISVELEQELENLCREYSGQVALEWNAYCIPWIRWVLKYCLKIKGFDVKYHDVNKKSEELSERLKKEGYNVPIVADTDLHARAKKHLQVMGTSRIISELEGETARDITGSLKKNIFDTKKDKYENIKELVSPGHFFKAFGFPNLFPKYFDKPRA